jgi:Tfp pilus assembly protein PilF
MKRQTWFIAIVAGIVLVGFVIFRTSLPRRGVRDRHESASQPGAVSYPEGTTTVPELFDEAISLAENDKISDAEAVYRNVVELEPNNAPGYIGLASSRFSQVDLKEAEKHYRRALSIDPGSSMAMLGLGSVASRRGEHSAALEFYSKALATYPDLSDAHWGLAITYERMGDWNHAAMHYDIFLKLAPQSNLATMARARLTETQRRIGPLRNQSHPAEK